MPSTAGCRQGRASLPVGVIGRSVGEGQMAFQAVAGCLPAEVRIRHGIVIAGDLVKICCDPQRAMIPKRRRSIAAATAAQHRWDLTSPEPNSPT
jgi:hypothetical protein